MSYSPARKTAYEILRRVESGHGFATDLLQRPEVSALKVVDRGLATELVMGVLRWRGGLDHHIERLAARRIDSLDPEVLAILRLGVYQIRFLERVPKRAAVNDAVELTKAIHKRSAAGLINAVLRRCEPPVQRLPGPPFDLLSAESRESVWRAFPDWLLKRWEGLTTASTAPAGTAAARLAYACLATPRATLRVMAPGESSETVRQELEAEGVVTSPCRYAGVHGLTVESGHVQDTRAYREGRVVIQDEASQLVAELVSPHSGQRVLDLCSAPGIKTGQIAQMLGSGTLLACDVSATRLRTMAKLLPRWVPASVHFLTVRLDAALPLPFRERFDRILLDAPCSGTGTLARNPEIKWRLQPQDITRLADLQARMLRNALQVLDRRGRLVYTTCSLEPEENAGVVEKVLAQQPGFRMLTSGELALEYPHLITLFESRGYFRTWPDQHHTDGFNAAVIVAA